jgi:hypothetical protein
MVLVLGSRDITKDIDAYLAHPTHLIREAAVAVADAVALPADRLNDGIKGLFYAQPPQDLWRECPGLRVYTVGADYMAALKAIAMRDQDREALVVLFKYLGFQSIDDVWAIIDQYIPTRGQGSNAGVALLALTVQ